jgi:hypothetical protein
MKVEFVLVEDGIEDQDGSTVKDARGDFQAELTFATTLAKSAYDALSQPNAASSVAYKSILAQQSDSAASIEELKGIPCIREVGLR